MAHRLNLDAGPFSRLGKISEMECESLPLTPITSISRDLGLSRITSCSDDDDDVCMNENLEDAEHHRSHEASECGLFRNAFKIKGTPESAVKKKKPRSLGSSSCSTPTSSSTSAKRARKLVVGMSSRGSSPASSTSPAPSSGHENECSAIFSLGTQNSTPHKPGGFKLTKPRFPLEEFDPNSQDSGYDGSCVGFGDEKPQQQQQQSSQQQPEQQRTEVTAVGPNAAAAGAPGFQFAEPLGVAPRRLSLESRSPMKSPVRFSPQRKRPALFRSTSSGYESTDDGFNDLIDMESLDSECSQLPNGLSSLISGNIVAADTSLKSSTATPKSSNDENSLPSINDLTAETITTTPETATLTAGRPRLAVRRSLSLQIERAGQGPNDSFGYRAPSDEERSPPALTSRVRSCLFRSPNATCSAAKLSYDESPRLGREPGICSPPPSRKFKRPEPPVDHSPLLVKRSKKSASFQDFPSNATSLSPLPSPQTLQRSYSETEAHAHIKHAINRSTSQSDLTGDFSKPCVLPLADGQHEDLKSISCETLSRLIKGDFTDCVSDFKIVDCRYPYEYEAGHIEGALNLYTKEMIEKFLLDPLQHAPAIEPDHSSKRSILVFHCEFSWERGPNLSRFLRSVDRQRNKEHYPALHYPEIYLLHGGYQKFYKEQKDMCAPQGYRPMRHPDHEADLRQFRAKSKSWQGEKTSRPSVISARATLKRLGF